MVTDWSLLGTEPTPDVELTQRTLPYWLMSMQPDDQVHVAGSIVVIAQVRLRRPELAAVLNELSIVDTPSPVVAAARARELADQFADRPPRYAPDGIDDNARIGGLARSIEDRITRYYPEASA